MSGHPFIKALGCLLGWCFVQGLRCHFTSMSGKSPMKLEVTSRHDHSCLLGRKASIPNKQKFKQKFCPSFLKILSKNQFLTSINGHYSVSLGPIWPKFELCLDFLVVLVTWKKEDPIKNVGTRVFTTIFQTCKGRLL